MYQDDDLDGILHGRIVAEDVRYETFTMQQTCKANNADWERYPIGTAVVLMTETAYIKLVKMTKGVK